jgi:glutaminyl-tRNA synthetase
VSAAHAVEAEVRLYEHLFLTPEPGPAAPTRTGRRTSIPGRSSGSLPANWSRPSATRPRARYQFEGSGYFCMDAVDSAPGRPAWNRIVSLRDAWAKIEQIGG